MDLGPKGVGGGNHLAQRMRLVEQQNGVGDGSKYADEVSALGLPLAPISADPPRELVELVGERAEFIVARYGNTDLVIPDRELFDAGGERQHRADQQAAQYHR